MTEPVKDVDHLARLLAECATLTDATMAPLDPAIRDLVPRGATPSVAIRFDPASAQVFADAPSGHAIELGRVDGAAIRAALATAAADFLNDAIAGLAPAVQASVASAVQRGNGKLCVLVDAFPCSARVLFDATGAVDPAVLTRLDRKESVS
jgi:hypothetical protein